MDDFSITSNHLVDDETSSTDLAEQLRQLKVLLENSSASIEQHLVKSVYGEDCLVDDLMAFYDGLKQDETNFDILCKEEDGRVSLAYERLPGIPKNLADKFALRTHTLDLSYNNIKDLTFLSNFKILHTLILDNNVALNDKSLPFLPSLRILWLNKCEINQLSKWVQRINICTPNIRQLSLMGNPGIRSTFNGGSTLENDDYMMYVIGSLPNLEYLDDVKISDEQRAMARAHINTYSINGVPINFVEHFSNTAHMLTNSKYDGRTHRRYTKFGNGINKLVPKRNGTKIDRL